jgi:hypothetical protein
MDATKEEVLSLLNGWFSEGKQLTLFLHSKGPTLTLRNVKLDRVSPDVVEISSPFGELKDVLRIRLPIDQVNNFEYVEPKEAHVSVRDILTNATSSILAMHFTPTSSCLLFELR